MKERDINRAFQDPTASAAFTVEGGYNLGDTMRRAELLRFSEVYEARKQRKSERRQELRMRRIEQTEGGV